MPEPSEKGDAPRQQTMKKAIRPPHSYKLRLSGWQGHYASRRTRKLISVSLSSEHRAISPPRRQFPRAFLSRKERARIIYRERANADFTHADIWPMYARLAAMSRPRASRTSHYSRLS